MTPERKILFASIALGAAGWLAAAVLAVSLSTLRAESDAAKGKGNASAAATDGRMLVYLVNQNGQAQPIDANAWYLVLMNQSRQALPAESESQCAAMLAKLEKGRAVCRQGSTLAAFD